MRSTLPLLLLFPWLVAAQTPPEPPTAWQNTNDATGTEFMVSTADIRASRAAKSMLERGGSAVDAAIAAQMVLNLVEPQSSGIGGGSFMLYYDAARKDITSFDGRETAPAAVTPDLFLDEQGKPMPFMKAVRNGKAVGVPGMMAMLADAHARHGKLPWASLFEPAIQLAERGYRISPRLYASIKYATRHEMSDQFKLLYLDSFDRPRAVDTLLTNPNLARTLTRLAHYGGDYFYHEDFAGKLVKAANERGGNLSLEDFERYRAIERPASCAHYRDNLVCTMDAPSSGVSILQTLGILEFFFIDEWGDMEAIHKIVEAQKRSFADRNRYVSDPAFNRIPISHMLSFRYLRERAEEITEEASAIATAGDFGELYAADASYDIPSTTHLSIVDAAGNAVSMTSSVEHSFGSGIMVEGFVLNNQLTDFSFLPEENGVPVANAVAPGKRPRSSMSPTMIFDRRGDLRAVLGSPGGSNIIPYVTKTIIAILDWDMGIQEAINSPHFMDKNEGEVVLESESYMTRPLQEMGHKTRERRMSSGINAITIDREGLLTGAADPRREGEALGR